LNEYAKSPLNRFDTIADDFEIGHLESGLDEARSKQRTRHIIARSGGGRIRHDEYLGRELHPIERRGWQIGATFLGVRDNDCPAVSGTGETSTARHRPNHEEGLVPRDDGFRESCLGIVVRDVLFTDEEADERATFLGDRVSNRPEQHGVSLFEGVDHRTLAGDAGYLEFNLATLTYEGL
jgi:hypothetical protein